MNQATKIKSLLYDFCKSTENHPDKIFIIVDNERYSYSTIYAYVTTLVSSIRKTDSEKGAYIAVDVVDPVLHVVSILAVNFFSSISLIVPNENKYIRKDVLDLSNAALLITDQNYLEHENKINLSYDLLDSSFSDKVVLNQDNFYSDADAPAMVYFTSGTSSGIRKGVVQTAGNLFYTSRYISSFSALNENSVDCIASPYDNCFWFGRVRVAIYNGSTVVVSKGSINLIKILNLINNYKVNSISGDGSVFLMMLGHLYSRFVEVSDQIKWIKIASQPLPDQSKIDLCNLFKGAKIIFNYGLTEAMRCCMLDVQNNKKRISSVGRPSIGVEIKIVDCNGNNLPSSKIGRIVVRGVNLALTYLNNKKMWESGLIDGWYLTGDLGYLDKDNYLYVLGREDDAINVGGRKVAPSEVENIVEKYFKGYSIAVIGNCFKSSISGCEVCIVLERTCHLKSPDFEKIRGILLKDNSKYLVPSCFYVIDKIPRTSNGKTLNKELLKILEGCNPKYRSL